MATKEERNARARDNQRLSRARRLDYIATLEEKVRQFEKAGASANQELQASARFVEKQNTLLKSWLCRSTQLRESDLQEWLKLPADQADQFFNSYLSSSRNYLASLSQDRSGSFAALSSSDSMPPPLSAPLSAPLSYASENSYADSSHNSQVPYYDIQGNPIPYPINHLNQYIPLRRQTAPAFPVPLGRTSSRSPRGEPIALPATRHTNTVPFTGYEPGSNSDQFVASTSSNSRDSPVYMNNTRYLPNSYVSSIPGYPPTMSPSYARAYISDTESAAPAISSQLGQASIPRIAEGGLSMGDGAILRFPNLTSLIGDSSQMTAFECGSDLGPVGQDFCTLLTLLAPGTFAPSDQASSTSQMSSRESYQALQHMLGGKMSVEEVIGRLMNSSRSMGNADDTVVDMNAVREILETVGVDLVQ